MLGDLSEVGKAAEPNALDPSSGLGDCGEQSIAPFGTHRRFCGGRMKDALNGHKAWRDPGKLDRDWRTAGSLLAGTGVFGLLTRRIEADFQCLRGDDHARDMALDEVAVRKSGRRPTPASFSGWLISRVAPHAAAWIEGQFRRPSRRGVDRNFFQLPI